MKDAYYFSHDSNARNDQRIIKLRRKYGAEGVGIYWMIVEILREQEEYKLGMDDDTVENIAYDLRVDQDKLEDIILHFDLFKKEIIDDGFGFFYSCSLKRRMEKADMIRQKRSYAGKMSGKTRKVSNTSSTNDEQVLNIKGKEKKGKERKVKDINKRYDEFKDQVKEFILIYDEDMINDFVSYWTEPNKGDTKMKFEEQKYFDIKRRLVTWSKNNFGNNKKNGVKGQHNFKMPDGKNYLAWCNKCLKSDFYESYNFNPSMIESKCCNAKILDENEKNKQMKIKA